MAELTAAQRVWNRACDLKPASSRPGDRALNAMLGAHGLICNGGVLHCVDALRAIELRAAEAGYRYFGLPRVAALLEKARRGARTGRAEVALDRAYFEIVPTDQELVSRFEEHYREHAGAYAPVGQG